ncbi:MAG: HIT family protein [Bacteroidetes bacterium]|nr:HIT family protein [Bacteroidota bacterium]
MASIFSKIIAGIIPAYKIAEDADFLAFLDINPLAKGHTLVIPKMEVDKAFDLPKDVLAKWLVFAQPIAHAIEPEFPCNRCGISVVGLEVPHAHMHLIPLQDIGSMNFSRPKLTLSSEEFLEVQTKLLGALERSK